MARRGVYGVPGEKLSRLALLEQEDKRQSRKSLETGTTPLIRLAMAAVGGIFLLMGQASAFWAWPGAVFFMLAIAGARPETGAAAGAIAAAISYFRMIGPLGAGGAFWLIMLLYVGGGALAGSLGALISKRLPPQLFAFLAALLPAGIEHLGSFGATAELTSTALTQYGSPFVARMSRLGGLAGVTYIIYLFGGSVASGVRYVRDSEKLVWSSIPAMGVVLVGLLYGAVTGASSDDTVLVMAINNNSLSEHRTQLLSKIDYDETAWNANVKDIAEQAHRYGEKPIMTNALGNPEESKTTELLIWPEAQVAVNEATRQTLFDKLEGTARATGCMQAAAYYDVSTTESRTVLTTAANEVSEGYSRRRFVPGADDVLFGKQVVTPGTDDPKTADAKFGKVGSLLSLDANYVGNFKTLAGDGARLVAVHGWDDSRVPLVSFRLLVYNAIRTGLPVVRATLEGTMALVSADGVILESRPALARADTTLSGSVKLGRGRTAYLKIGDTFAWFALLVGVAAGLYASTLEAPDEPGKSRRKERAGPLTYRTRDGHKGV